jgi:hypothetical protein
MQKEIQNKLEPLCRREHLVQMLGRCAIGVLVGASLATLLGAVAILSGSSVMRIGAVVCLLAGASVGVAAAVLIRKDWAAAARAVDARFALADRTLTALACAEATPARPVDQLQLRDALAHLQRVNPRDAARQRLDWKQQSAATALLVISLVVVCWPAGAPPVVVKDPNEAARAEFLPRPVPEVTVPAEAAVISLDKVTTRRELKSTEHPASNLTRAAQIRQYYETTQPPP